MSSSFSTKKATGNVVEELLLTTTSGSGEPTKVVPQTLIYECVHCPQTFTFASELATHCRTHSRQTPFECHICLKQFTQISNLNAHSKVHNGDKRHECGYCGINFAKRDDCMKHIRRHTGHRPYACHVDGCTKMFNQQGTLVIHRQWHQQIDNDIDTMKKRKKKLVGRGVEKYECQSCVGKAFDQKGTLKLHQRIHSGYRPYQCEYCNDRFYQKVHSISHQLVHTGQKPYTCRHCSSSFNQPGYLSIHQRSHKRNIASIEM